jgi:hypothetical protein
LEFGSSVVAPGELASHRFWAVNSLWCVIKFYVPSPRSAFWPFAPRLNAVTGRGAAGKVGSYEEHLEPFDDLQHF